MDRKWSGREGKELGRDEKDRGRKGGETLSTYLAYVNGDNVISSSRQESCAIARKLRVAAAGRFR